MSVQTAQAFRVGSSRSLWNCSIAPGWSPQEAEILKICLMKYGIGRWKAISLSGCLPTKNIQQMYTQTQRLIGQQSMAEFVGLHVDLEAVFRRNQERLARKDPRYIVKHGLLINAGDNFTKKDIEAKKRENIAKFGLSFDYYNNLKPPKAKTKEWLKVLTPDQILNDKTRFSSSQRVHHLKNLKKAIIRKIYALERFEKFKLCNIGIIVKRTDTSPFLHDAKFEFEERVELDPSQIKKVKEYRRTLDEERERKREEIREKRAQAILNREKEEAELLGPIQEEQGEDDLDFEMEFVADDGGLEFEFE